MQVAVAAVAGRPQSHIVAAGYGDGKVALVNVTVAAAGSPLVAEPMGLRPGMRAGTALPVTVLALGGNVVALARSSKECVPRVRIAHLCANCC